jgi:hypothetical protein
MLGSHLESLIDRELGHWRVPRLRRFYLAGELPQPAIPI